MAARLGDFIIFIFFAIITLGLYPLFFFLFQGNRRQLSY